MEFIIFRTGGKQYKAQIGDVLDVDRLVGDKNKDIIISDILLWASDTNLKMGKPNIDGASVRALIVDHKKGDKIRVAKFKAKARYRRVMGFRPQHTTLKIEEFKIPGAKTVSNAKKASVKPRVRAVKK